VHAFKNQWVLSMCTCSLAISIVEIYGDVFVAGNKYVVHFRWNER
jgi:hypothetical protein